MCYCQYSEFKPVGCVAIFGEIVLGPRTRIQSRAQILGLHRSINSAKDSVTQKKTKSLCGFHGIPIILTRCTSTIKSDTVKSVTMIISYNFYGEIYGLIVPIMDPYIFSEKTVYFQSLSTVYFRRPYIFCQRTQYFSRKDRIFFVFGPNIFSQDRIFYL